MSPAFQKRQNLLGKHMPSPSVSRGVRYSPGEQVPREGGWCPPRNCLEGTGKAQAGLLLVVSAGLFSKPLGASASGVF